MASMDVDDNSPGPSSRPSGIAYDELGTSTHDPSSSRSRAAMERVFEDRKASRSLAVPTSDPAVRQRLRDLGEPQTCFAEANVDRRERLREALLRERQRRVEMGMGEGEGEDDVRSEESGDEGEEQDEEFYTEGTEALLEARRDLAWYSLARAKQRIARQRWEAKVSLEELVRQRQRTYEPFKHFTSLGSQPASDRPISQVRFSPGTGSLLATASWSGQLKLWSVPSCNPYSQREYRGGHTDRIGGLAWHPSATLGADSAAGVNLATGGAEGNVCLWSLEQDSPIATLKGHEARVARVAFHPSGQYVASASFDGTWRLWSLASRESLLVQEGHSREVYAVEFHPDGSLIGSGGLDALGRLWDLRTGKAAMVLDGHAREILAMDFHPSDGYHVVTASGDDTVRVWDMRALKSVYTIPAHTSSVADVRFFRGGSGEGAAGKTKVYESDMDTSHDVDSSSAAATERTLSNRGLYLCTAGYDGLVKVWSSDDWQLLRTLSGDNGKVMSVDASPSGEYLASGEWGRTFKLWGAL